jgi:xylan 1,4-beta-xylosidase
MIWPLTVPEGADWMSQSDAGGWAGGVFANPVIAGFYPDPSVCRVGGDYYLACSSFEYFPGVPVFHSRDLVHWEQIGNARQWPLPATTPSSGGVYAPTLRHHDGLFWLIAADDSGSTVLVTAADPAGPWSEPLVIAGINGVDPDIAWDDAGRCWCTYAGIAQVRIDPQTGDVLDGPRRIWSGTPGARYPEAPHLYRIGDFWYLLIAEGGTERGHCVSVARSLSPDGPFDPSPANPVLTHRSTSRPVQNTGHADLIQAPDGSWWMVLLGVRPRGGSPGWHTLGRETYLVPVTWADGWPAPGQAELAVAAPPWPPQPAATPPARDDFDLLVLHPHWISLRSRPAAYCSVTETPGWLTLHARGASLDDPDVTFAGRRPQHLSWRARALADADAGRGGLAVRLDERHHYEVEMADGQVSVVARIGPLRQTLSARPVPAGAAVLRIEAHASPPGMAHPLTQPDALRLGVEEPDGTFSVLADLDGRYLSTEVAGGFTGRVIGMYAAAGTMRFDWFDYEPLGD